MFYIGDILIKNKVCLAPMAGVSNAAYMKIIEEMGCGYAISELISSEAIVRNNKKTFDMLKGFDKLNMPVAIQLFGSNVSSLVEASKILVNDYNVKIIDINMGCPVSKVALRSGAGSALLKNPSLVYSIVSSVVNSVDVPVTVKIRSGWDMDSINAVEIAKICEKAGAKCITIHGRTRSQGYSGSVSLDIIKEVKESVSIPVIGNGDVCSFDDLKHMLDYTKCDAVMIGRACIGNPFLIRDCVSLMDGGRAYDVTLLDRINMIKKHFEYLLSIKPERIALLEMRMHIPKYLKGYNGANVLSNKICSVNSIKEVYDLLDLFLEGEENV